LKRVTVYDIAEALDLSPSTVSRSLNGSSLISPETRKRVMSVADGLGYRKRAVRRQRSRAILNIKLIIPGFSERYRSLFYDPADLVRGIREGAEEVRFNLLLDLNDDDLAFFDHKKGGDLDGVICAFSRPPAEILETLAERDVPVLTLHRQVEGGDYVDGDNRRGMYDLVQRLHERFGSGLQPAFLGFSRADEVSSARRLAVAAACGERGVGLLEENCLEVDGIESVTPELVQGLVDNGVNALLTYNDLIGAAALRAAQLAGIPVPKQLALTGFDNSPIRSLLPQPLDTINLPVYEFGVAAGQWIVARVIERSEEPVRQTIAGEYLAGATI
jgi:LacI family transcriptional regulator